MNSSLRESFSSRTFASERRMNTDPWQQQMYRSQSPHHHSTQSIIQNSGNQSTYGNSSAENNQLRKSTFLSGEQGNRYKYDPDQVEHQSSVPMASNNNLSSSQRTQPQQQSGPLHFSEEDNRPRRRSTQQQHQMFSSVRIPTNRPQQGFVRRRSSDDYRPISKPIEPFVEGSASLNFCVLDELKNYQQMRKSDPSDRKFQSMRLSFSSGGGGEEMNASLTRLSYQPVASPDMRQNQIDANLMANNASTEEKITNRLNRRSFVSQQSTLSNLRTHHSSMTMPRQRRSWVRDVEIDPWGSTGCVITESERSALRELEAISCIDSKSQLEEGLALDDDDIKNCEVIAEPSHRLCEQTFSNPICTHKKTEKFYTLFKKWLNTSQLEEIPLEKNLQDSCMNGDDSRCKTLSEDESGVDFRRVVNAFVCGGILIAVIVAVVVICTAPSGSNHSTSSGFEVNDSPSGPPARLNTHYSTLPIPVRDIEGRCSPSNFPGSVGACSEACDVAACCYPGFSAEPCYDEADINTVKACGRFRPHCDSMFAPWTDALMGGIAPPPSELFNKKEWDEVCLGRGGFEDVRLPNKRRSHNHYMTDHNDRQVKSPSRFLDDSPIQPSACKEACNPGKCCFAPFSIAGLFKTPDGVHINATSGDMEMTSCMNERNLNRCLQYTKKCSNVIKDWATQQTDEDRVDKTSTPTTRTSDISPVTTNTVTAWPSVVQPSAVPQSNTALIHVPGATQSLSKPTSLPTSLPSLSPKVQSSNETLPPIPLPQVYEINKFCTGPLTLLNIAEGVLNSVMDCQRACRPGSCCFVDLTVIGGQNTEDSCFTANREICMAYSDCLALAMTPDDVAYLDSNGDYAVVDYNTYGPPEPTADVAQYCSSSATQADVLECFKVCNPASCCGATEQDLSCFDNYEETCALYGPCLYMSDAYGGDTKSLPPTPPADLSVLCSYSSLSKTDVEYSECSLACLAGMCCLDNSCPPFDSIELLQDQCALYEPCNHLSGIPMPSDDIQQVCEENSLSAYSEDACTDACAVSSCCFTDDDDPCFANFEESCVAYAPYCAPSMQENDVETIRLQPAAFDLAELCVGPVPSSACQEACSVASCCFLLSDRNNCWAENEEVCGQFAICAFLFQEYEESLDEFT